MPIHRRNPFSVHHGFALMVMAWLLTGGITSVQAACGDYVHSKGVAADLIGDQQPAPGRPCSGPTCQEHTPADLPIPTVWVRSISKGWLSESLARPAAPPLVGGAILDLNQDAGDEHPVFLDRPPRAS